MRVTSFAQKSLLSVDFRLNGGNRSNQYSSNLSALVPQGFESELINNAALK